MERKDIFISYKSEDFAQAQWLCSVLETNGLSCWMAPTSIPGGSNYAREIPQAIDNCKIFVLALTEQCQDSIWVPKELDRAINAGKIIMPFMLENCALTDDFNFYLSNVQRYEAYQNKAAAMERMLRDIHALLGAQEKHAGKPPMVYSAPKAERPVGKTQKPLIVAVIALCLVVAVLIGIMAKRPKDEPQQIQEPQPTEAQTQPTEAQTQGAEEVTAAPESIDGLQAADVIALEEKMQAFIDGRGTGFPEIQMNDGSVKDLSADKLANCITAFSCLESGYIHTDTPMFDEVTTWIFPFCLSLEDVPYNWVDTKYYDEAQLFDFPSLYGYFSLTDLKIDENGNLVKEGSFGIEMSKLYENQNTMQTELASHYKSGERMPIDLNRD